MNVVTPTIYRYTITKDANLSASSHAPNTAQRSWIRKNTDRRKQLTTPYSGGVINKVVAGTVSAEGVPGSGYTVRLLRKDTLKVLGEAVSNEGSFAIHTDYPGLCTCIAYDKDSLFNSLVFDFVQPVTQ